MPCPKTFTLNSGIPLPTVLYGSYNSISDNGVNAMVYAVDEAGYRGIDTALYYNNHNFVAEALQKMKTPRDQIFLQTKIWPTQMREPEKWLDVALKELKVDYVDMFMIHWPIPLKGDKVVDEDWDFIKTWELMEKIPTSKARSIGVSNFSAKQLQKLLDNCTIPPAANQCEFHPRFPQQELVDFCLQHNVRPEAYRPLAKGQVDNPIIQSVANAHKCDVGQVILSWNVMRGVAVLPKSTTDSRIKSNISLVDLSEEDIEKINTVGNNPERTCLSLKIYGYDIFADN